MSSASFAGIIGVWLAGTLALPAAGPVITQHPQNANVIAGDNATFQVTASGTAPLAYQWHSFGTNLLNQTNATLILSNVQSSQTGPYRAVVSNLEGSTTSSVAQLIVRAPGTSIYLPPPGGWNYRYEGSNMAATGNAALDGTWNHDNGSDAWAGDLRGPGNLPEGGLSVTNGILTMEDVLVSGAGNDNRRLYFTHVLSQDPLTNANTILNDGVTFNFRARLTPPPPVDPLTELTNAPNGFINTGDGKGMFGMRQSGSSGMIISFSLNMAIDDTNATTTYAFPAAGLHMNNLFGNSRGANVDPGEGGTVNVFPIDPTAFHEFWITVQDNGADPGTHRVAVYANGSTTSTIFNVTAGIGSDGTPITNYLAMGLPSTFQRGAFDLDWLGYRQGVHVPVPSAEPVQIVSQPASQTVNEGETATFNVVVAGTAPISFQWFRNGVAIPGATTSSYTTAPVLPADSNTVFHVECQNVGGTAVSDPAILSVIADNTPPVLLTAASFNGQTIGLCFSERITQASAGNVANYTVNNGQVNVASATLRTNANSTTVLLQISGLAAQAGTELTVRATNIFDASFATNRGGGTVQGVVHGLIPADVGVANGSAFTCSSNRFELSAAGTGLGGTADAFHFISMQRTGDFDVRVRMPQLAASHSAAQAGLVARMDQTQGSRSLNVFVTPPPGDNAYHATHRATAGGSTASWEQAVPPATAPPWIRLTRAGDTFAAYHGTNGVDWQIYAQRTEVLPATIFVGVAGAGLLESIFDEIIFIPPPEIITQPVSVVATNGDLVTFSVQATSRAEIRYQWTFNGADLTNQTNATLVFASVNPTQAGTYRVRVSNGGGTVLSVAVTLTVRVLDYGDANGPYPTLLANNGARHLLVPGFHLGAAADFELNGFPSAGANGDDLNGIDDEDGVRFVTPLWVDQTATIEVVASSNGVLNGWIDFGADGSWAQSADHVFIDYALEPGTNLLSLIVPFDAKGTNTSARFRFSSVGGLAPQGPAIDGEVEDYVVDVVPVADLSIASVDSPDPVAVGSNLTYQVMIGNLGPAVATGVLVTNGFSVPVEFVSAVSTRGSCVGGSGLISCDIGDLGLGSNAIITMVVKPLQTGTLSSSLGIQANQPDPNTGNNLVVNGTTVESAPSITIQPTSLTVTQHNTATFSVTVTGTAPLAYQWFHNGSPLAGGTGATLIIPDALDANQGTYQVRITNRVGGALSQPVTLTVWDPPVITQPPQSRTNLAGSVASFTVTATGTPPLSYQWFFNGTTLLPGATNASLTLSNVQASQAGLYSVRVSNSAGVTNSASATLTVIEMDFGDAPAPFPTLLADDGARHRIVPGFRLGSSVDFEPDGQVSDGSDEDGVILPSAVLPGQNARIDVTASSNGVLNAWVDWNGNGNWSDAGERIFTDRTLTSGVNVLNATVPVGAQSGARAARFRFSTATGLSFTGEALDGEVEDYLVNVQPAVDLGVSVVANPSTVRVGSNVLYSIVVTNGGPSAASGVVLTSALPASVTVTSLPGGCTNQGGVIHCNLGGVGVGVSTNLQIQVVPNQAMMASNFVSVLAAQQDSNLSNNTAVAVVAVLEFPAIVSQPQSLVVTNGDAATFQVTATGSLLSYQWSGNGSDLPNATNSTLTISPAGVADEGAYRVRVSNALGQVISDAVQLTVLLPPVITSQPVGATVVAGSNATFAVSASGTAPLFYQWSFGESDLPEETNATLAIASVNSSHEGVYRVRVSNAAGEVLSSPANLAVLVPANIIQQPQSKTVFAGGNASLQVVAGGTEPITYQWRAGTLALGGATNATLVISNVQVSNRGEYTVVVSNSVTVVTSAPAVLTVREADFGDAQGPSYATLLVFNGAYHYVTPGIRLGSAIDFEPDGQPSPIANGDDVAGTDDEDGVVFETPLLVGQAGRVNVSASTNGLLDAWIDFNGNGDWTDAGEQVFTNRALVAGNNALSFVIPPTAVPHGALSRFRFSTAGGLFFSGGAADGEVEDHLAEIAPAIDLAVSLVDQPDPVLVQSNLHLIATVSNAGPSTATSVSLRNVLPISTTFAGATLSQGSCSNQAGVLNCDLGDIPAGGSVIVDIDLVPTGIGLAGSRAEVSAPERDLNTTNNLALQMTTVVTISGPFLNPEFIVINDFGPAAIYPSTINVSGVTGSVHQVVVTLHNFSHLYPDDVDMLLVGPRGQRMILMSDAGGGFDPAYTTFSLDDRSDLILPDEDLIIDEPYRPANYEDEPDPFDAPAPAGPYTNRLAAFKGTDANGVWSLYIMDDFAQDSGELAGGWSLSFLVLDPIADAGLGMVASPSPAAMGQNVTYTLLVTNGGPSAVAEMLVTNVLPSGVILQSFSASQGSCTNVGSEITCDLGVMEGGATASITFVVTPQDVGVLSNYARVTPSQVDLNQSNNSSFLLTPVLHLADLAITTSESQDPAPFGQPFTYTLRVSNRGPQLATGISASDQLPADFQFVTVSSSQGSCSNQSGVVLCDLGDLATGNVATIQITGQGTRIGRFTNSASVQGNIVDSDLSNNQTTEETVLVFAAPAFVNAGGIVVPDPYPSIINISGLTGAIYKVSVMVSNLNHPSPESLQLLLVGPSGQNVLLMNSAGGNTAVANVTLRFDDQALLVLPDSSAISSGTYRPSSYSAPASLPAPAPGAPYGSALSVFPGTEANGTWSLYTRGGGTIGAWGLEISTLEPIVDVSVGIASIPAAVSVGSNLTYVVTVSNRGPAVASSILYSNVLPVSFGLTSASGCTNTCNLGALNAGSQIQIQVQGVALAEGLASNLVSAFAPERDLNPANNTATVTTVMKTPPIISAQPQSLTVTNGDTATFTVGVTGAGPFAYQWLLGTVALPGETNSTLVISNAQQSHAGDYAVRVSDGIGSPLSATARLTVLNRPTISDIGDITILEDTSGEELPFTIGDVETGNLQLELASSNSSLIPLSNIFLTGTGGSRGIRVSPATNQYGVAMITVTVRDGDGITASDQFEVTVTSVNDLPVITPVATQTLGEDIPRAVVVDVADVEDTVEQLVLSAFSNDSNLFTVAVSGRTLTISPRPDEFGTGSIRLVLTDTGGGAVSNSFDVIISPVNDPPTLSFIPDVSIEEKAGLTVVPLSGITSGAANEAQSLTVSASMDNSNLLAALTVDYTSGASGSLSFQTISNRTGRASISVTVDDGGASNNIVSRLFLVLVGEVNDPPVISAIADQIIAEDATLSVNFTVSDEETPVHLLGVAAVSSNTNLVPSLGLAVLGTNSLRTLSATPVANQSGVAFITVSLSDGQNTNTVIFQLRVMAVNDPPTLEVVSVLNLPENSEPQTVSLNDISAGPVDEPHNLLMSVTSSNPALIPDPLVHYSNPDTNGTLTFTPQLDTNGTAVITIVVNDRGTSNNLIVRTITVNVSDQNNAPTISRIFNQTTPEDTTIDIPFSVFDADSAVDTLAISALSANNALIPNGTLTVTGTGANRLLRAVPTPNASGSASITVTVTDTNGASASATFLLMVDPMNDPPTLADIPDQQISEDAAMGPVFFYVNDLETSASAMSLSAVSSNPSLVPQSRIVFGGAGTNRWIRIIPALNRSGSTFVTVTARDDDGGSVSDSFLLTVQATNDPPVISVISDQATTAGAPIVIPFTVNDLETLPGALLISAVSSNPGLLPSTNIIRGGSGVNRSVVLNPIPAAVGSATVTITVTDGGGATASENFVFQVTSGTGPPVITVQPESQTVTNGSTVTFSAAASGAPTLRYRWRLRGTNLPLATNFTYVITNVQLAHAGDYTVAVGNTLASVTSVVATLTVVYPPGAGTPQITTIPDQVTPEDSPLPLTISLQDLDTAPHFLTLSVTSTNTSLVPATNYIFEGAGFTRTLTVIPAANQSGTNLITVTVSDGTFSSSDSFVLRVTAVNDPPTLDRVPNVSALPNAAVAVPLSGIGPGAPNETNLVNIAAAHNNPAVLSNLTVNYTPGAANGSLSAFVPANATGSATVTITATDGGPSTVRTFQILARPATNSNPTISSMTNVVISEDTSTGPIPFTVGDADGSANLISVIAVSSNTNLAPPSSISVTGTGTNRTITINPATNQFGSALITLTASDTQSGLMVTNFTLTVTPVNDLPVLPTILTQPLTEDTASAPIAIAVRDVETVASALALSGSSSNPTLIPDGNLIFGGSGSNRVLVIQPAATQTGSALITLTLTDLDGGIVSTNFSVTVGAVNDTPKISSISDVTIPLNTSTPALPFTISDEETQPDGLTVGATSSDSVLVPSGSILLGGTGANRTIAIQPAAGRSGASTITVSVSDGNTTGFETFVLRVTQAETNAPPAFDAVADVSVNEDSGLVTINLMGISAGSNETDQVIAISARSSNPDLIPDPTVSYTSPSASGTLAFTPHPGTNGIASITVTAHDGKDLFSRSFNVTVRARPVIMGLHDLAVDEDTVSPGLSFMVNDIETPVSNLTFVISSSNPAVVPASNVVVSGLGTNRTLTVSGAPDQFGHAIITLSVIDGDGLARSNSFAVVVDPVNDRPTLAFIDPVTLLEDQARHDITLAGIGSGAANEIQPLMIDVSSSNPGLVPVPVVAYTSPNASAALSLSTVPNAFGTATITVVINDGQSVNQFMSRSFEVTVSPIDDPPTLNPISDLTLEYDGAPESVFLTGITAGNINEGQTVTIEPASSNPAVVSNLTVSYTYPNFFGTLTVAPNAGVSGAATVTVTVSDGPNAVSQSFLVTVNPRPNQLGVSSISPQTTPEDVVAGPISFAIAGMQETEGLELWGLSSDSNLILPTGITFGGSGTNRTVTLAPQTNQFGSAIITIVARVSGNVASNSFQLTVTPIDDFPFFVVPVEDTTIDEDTSITIPFTVGDLETHPQLMVVGRTSYNMDLIPSERIEMFYYAPPTWLIKLTPRPNKFGTALIEVRVRDQQFQRATNNFILTVRSVNDQPIISPVPDHVTQEDQPFETGFFVEDVETAAENLLIIARSSDTTLVANDAFEYINNGRTRVLRGRPALNRSGTNVITVTVEDEHGRSATQSFNLRVLAVNDAPVILPGWNPAVPVSMSIGDPAPEIPFQIGDPDDALGALTLSARSSNTNLARVSDVSFSGSDSNRLVRVVPASGQSGLAIITIEVTDLTGAKSESSFELIVNGTNGPPVVVLHPADQQVNVGAAVSLRVVATGPGPLSYQWQRDGTNVTGATGATIVFTSVQRSDRGAYRAVVSNANGSVTSAAAQLQVYEAARIVLITRTGTTVEVTCESVPGQRYTLEYRESLASGGWTALTTLDGTGSELGFVDPGAISSAKFYRVRIE